VKQDLTAFLSKHPSTEIVLVGLTEQNGVKYNALQLRGQIHIQIQNKRRGVGFKFILPLHYPS